MTESVALSKDKSTSKTRDCSVVSETGEVRWHAIMRKFSESGKEQCKSVTVEMPRMERSLKIFPTGSQYEGTWDVLGISGYGCYVFPHGVVYEGDFEDGLFHGEGELRYESGATLRGQFKKGVMTERTLIFKDDLEYDENNFKYCQYPDRRYTEEYEEGIQPAGISYITFERPPIEIPPGHYDTGDGFYDPVTKVVYKYDDLTAIQRAPSTHEQTWIMANCRKNPDDPIGPMAHLYEEWSEPLLEPERTPKPAATVRGYGSDLFFNESGVLGPASRTLSDRFGFWRYPGGRTSGFNKSSERFSIKFGPELPSSNEIYRDASTTDLRQKSKQKLASASDVRSKTQIAGTGDRPSKDQRQSKMDQRQSKESHGSTAERPSKTDQRASKTDRGSTAERSLKTDQRASKTDRGSTAERLSKTDQRASKTDRGSTTERSSKTDQRASKGDHDSTTERPSKVDHKAGERQSKQAQSGVVPVIHDHTTADHGETMRSRRNLSM